MALDVVCSINLDMQLPYSTTDMVHTNQYDSGLVVKAYLHNGGEKWSVPSGAKAVVAFKKTDNIGGFYDVTELEPNTQAVSIDSDRSIIYISLDTNTTTTATKNNQFVEMQVVFYKDGKQISTFAFYMEVKPSVVKSSDVKSNWVFNILSQEIADTLTVATTPEAITTWLRTNIHPYQGYPIDDSLTIPGAASDAKATGQMVTVSDTKPNVVANKVWVKKTSADIEIPTMEDVGVAVDELGSVFKNQNELYLYHKSIENKPEYEFHFGDLANKRYISSLEERTGYSTVNHPFKYDTSMVLRFTKSVFTDAAPLHMYFGELIDGNFVPRRTINLSGEANNYSNSPCVMSLRRYKFEADKYTDPYIAFGVMLSLGTVAITENISLVRSNPFTKLDSVQILSLINDLEPYYIRANNDADLIDYYSDLTKTTINRVLGGWKYLYANGLYIDAIFYDKDCKPINESVGGLGAFDPTIDYPTYIEVPENAYIYKMAVYGYRAGNIHYSLGYVILEYVSKICAYIDVYHTPCKSFDAGTAIYNANKLFNFKYKAARLRTRYFDLNAAEDPNANYPVNSEAYGFLYGKRSLNVYISYYTYLTLMRHRHGYGLARDSSLNAYYGFVCTAFISEVLGLGMQQGTEWWLQNYADKMQLVDRNSELNPGDLVVMQRYLLKNGKPNLHTHIVLVTDVMADKKTGKFAGFKIAESTNIWGRHMASRSPCHALSAKDLNSDPNGTIADWRIHVPIKDVPRVDANYRFNIDKELDPLNNYDDIVFPPCVSYLGDMCMFGPHKTGYGSLNTSTIVYVEKTYSSMRVYRDDVMLDEFQIVDKINPSTNLKIYNGVELSEYTVDESGNGIPGVYTIYCDDNPKPTTLYIPDYPDVEVSDDGTTVTISGVTVTRKSGKVTSVKTSSFDEIWFRVIPFPVASIDGYPEGPPWANYMYVNGTELWDGVSFSVGNKYQYITRVLFINDTYGAIDYIISGDYDRDSDEPTDDDDDPEY